jgi:HSP20 family protein
MNIRDVVTRRRGENAERDDEWLPLTAFRREIDRLFDDFLPRSRWLPASRLGPNVDVGESEREVMVTAELPGLEGTDIEVSLCDRTLTLKGEKKADREEHEKTYCRTERAYGAFERVIPLPAEVQEDGAEAEFAKGVLTVHLPKAPAAPKKVTRIAVAARQ